MTVQNLVIGVEAWTDSGLYIDFRLPNNRSPTRRWRSEG